MKALLLALLLIGCVPKPVVVYQQYPLTAPPRIPLPTIQGYELQCLSDDVYIRMKLRELVLQKQVELCESEILSTHPVE